MDYVAGIPKDQLYYTFWGTVLAFGASIEIARFILDVLKYRLLRQFLKALQ